jgi:MFS transporter, SP family, general alpha glucoside:H+ symporter
MSNIDDNKGVGGISEVKGEEAHIDHAYDVEAKKEMAADKQGAIDAENQEHNMTVLEAVRAYPAASLWAFNMSCTIVCSAAPKELPLTGELWLI